MRGQVQGGCSNKKSQGRLTSSTIIAFGPCCYVQPLDEFPAKLSLYLFLSA